MEYLADTPSGDPMHYAYEEGGAKWNPNTGFWELNGLTDLTTKEIREIYNIFHPSFYHKDLSGIAMSEKVRTNMLPAYNDDDVYNIFYHFIMKEYCRSTTIKNAVIPRIKGYDETYREGAGYAVKYTIDLPFYNCSYLENVYGVFDFSSCKEDIIGYSFISISAFNLKEVRLGGVCTNIKIISRLISKRSILFAIENERAKKNITISLAPKAYDTAIKDPEITAALQAHPLISLASF